MTEAPAVLVIGGAGYIGSNAALSLLDDGHRVIVLDNLSQSSGALVPPAAQFVRGEAGDSALIAALIAAHGIGTVMHFAAAINIAESESRPGFYYENNVAHCVRAAGAAAAAGVKTFIFSSTAAVYGEGDGRPLKEGDPLAPVNVYGRSKMMAEMALRDIGRASGMAVGVLRYFNAAGADPAMRSGQATAHPHHLIEIATQVVTGRRAGISIYGTDYPTADGTAVRDYVHVRDIAEAHRMLMEAIQGTGAFRLYNVGSGGGASVREVLEALAGVSGTRIAAEPAPRRPGDPALLVADTARIRAELGWQPRHSGLETILQHALQWERQRSAAA